MNQDIIFAVKQQLSQAEDALYRAKVEFRGADLSVQHGQSGRTRGQILEECQKERDRWVNALKEAERR